MSVSFIPNPWHDVVINAGQQVGSAIGNLGQTIGDANSSGTRVNRPETWWYQNSPWSPNYFWSQFGDPDSPINSGISDLADRVGINGPEGLERAAAERSPSTRGYTPSYNGSGAGSSTAKELEYYYADLAKMYGMNRETAYAEAMANTSYQRAVYDMQAAGLNPAVLFSASKASSAGSGHVSGSSGGGFSSGKGASEDDQLPGWLFYGVSALAQVVGTVATKSFMGGLTASNVAQNFMRAWNGR